MDQLDVLLPYQAKIVQDTAPFVVVAKARRIGVTWSLAFLAVVTASSSPTAGGQNVWYMVYSEADAKLFIEDAAFWARSIHATTPVLENTSHPERSIMVKTIRFASGHTISILSSNPRVLRGKEGLLIVDEAAFLDDLASVRKAAAVFGMWLAGRVMIVSTHNGIENPFNELVEAIRDGQPGHENYSLHEVSLDDALADGLYRRIIEKARSRGIDVSYSAEAEGRYRTELLKEPGSDEELLLKPVGGGGVYIARKLIRQARQPQGEAPVVRVTFPLDFLTDYTASERAAWVEGVYSEQIAPHAQHRHAAPPYVVGVDIGRYKDLTVIWVLAQLTTGARETVIVVELARAPFSAQFEILTRIGDGLRVTSAHMDATGIGLQLAESALEYFGPSWVGVPITPGWYDEVMPALRGDFEAGRIGVPADMQLEADLLKIVRVHGSPRIQKRRTENVGGGSRHGDGAIALALANSAAEALDVGAVEWEEVSATLGGDLGVL